MSAVMADEQRDLWVKLRAVLLAETRTRPGNLASRDQVSAYRAKRKLITEIEHRFNLGRPQPDAPQSPPPAGTDN